jgi:hypothetical protein
VRAVVWALLALLGVPIWLVVGGLSGALISRRRFRAQEGVFGLSFREHGDENWPRGLGYGRYLNDVLLVNHGLALVKTSIHVVERAERFEADEPPKKIDDPVAWTLTLDDGQVVDVAVSAEDVGLLSLP